MSEALPANVSKVSASAPTLVSVLPYLVPNSPENPTQAMVVSLSGVGQPGTINVALPRPIFPSNPTVEFTSANVDATAAATAGFPGLVNVNASANAGYILCEISSTTTRAGMAGSIILKETWGYAFRLCVKFWGLAANASIQSVAANCTVNTSAVGSAFQVQVLGIPAGFLVGSLTTLTTLATGKFDMGQMAELGAIQVQLGKLILDSTLRSSEPELLAVELDLAGCTDIYTNSPSTMLALTGMAEGKTYNQTKSSQLKPNALPAGLSINQNTVQAVYDAMGVGSNTPTLVQKKAAAKSNFRGEGT